MKRGRRDENLLVLCVDVNGAWLVGRIARDVFCVARFVNDLPELLPVLFVAMPGVSRYSRRLGLIRRAFPPAPIGGSTCNARLSLQP